MVGGEVAEFLEPESGHLVENLPFQGDRAQHDIESANTIGNHDGSPVVLDVAVADLPFKFSSKLAEIRVVQGLVAEFKELPVVESQGYILQSRCGLEGVGTARGRSTDLTPHWAFRQGLKGPASPAKREGAGPDHGIPATRFLEVRPEAEASGRGSRSPTGRSQGGEKHARLDTIGLSAFPARPPDPVPILILTEAHLLAFLSSYACAGPPWIRPTFFTLSSPGGGLL